MFGFGIRLLKVQNVGKGEMPLNSLLRSRWYYCFNFARSTFFWRRKCASNCATRSLLDYWIEPLNAKLMWEYFTEISFKMVECCSYRPCSFNLASSEWCAVRTIYFALFVIILYLINYLIVSDDNSVKQIAALALLTYHSFLALFRIYHSRTVTVSLFIFNCLCRFSLAPGWDSRFDQHSWHRDTPTDILASYL